MRMRQRRFLICGLLSLLCACDTQETRATRSVSQDTLWLLGRTPDKDSFHASDSEATLVARYGRTEVVRGPVDLGEGETEPGTIVFPRDSTRRLQVHWSDTTAFARPSRVVVYDSASRWRIYPGVGMHTSLQELERLNARPFVLTGMGWDYSGTVMRWEKGVLDRLWPPQPGHLRLVWLRLSREANDALLAQVGGDHDFRSDLPAMARLNPRVYEMAIEPR